MLLVAMAKLKQNGQESLPLSAPWNADLQTVAEPRDMAG